MTIQVNKFIVCDDIRTEESKKLMIIGMYFQDKLFIKQDFPYKHTLLSFFVNVSGDIKPGKFTYKIMDPTGNPILESPPFDIKNEKNNANIVMGIVNLEFPSPGEYQLILNLPNNKEIVLLFYAEYESSYLKSKESKTTSKS